MCHAWRFIEIHGALAAPTVIGVLHVDIPALIRETFPVGPLQCNCTIIGDPLTRKAIVVDPGGDHELILQRLDRLGLQVVSIIHTHAHLDHFLASGEMKKRTGASLHLHKDDQFLWDNLEMQCQLFGVPYTPVPALTAGWPTTRNWPAVAEWHCTRRGIRRAR